MRRFFASALCALTIVAPVFSEPADNVKPMTSVKAYKDVDPNEEYHDCLIMLVEKYALIGAYGDDTFRPKEPLRRAELAGWLDRAATRAEELINIVSDEYPGDRTSS